MLETREIDVDQLRVGMFVSELDRPWLGTPFLLQGFKITSEEEIDQLKALCRHVTIDLVQSTVAPLPLRKPKPRATEQRSRQRLLEGRPTTRYEDNVSLAEELPAAKRALKGLTDSVVGLFRSKGEEYAVPVQQIRKSVKPVVDSICRNPDATIWLARLKARDQYTYQHSVACSIWSVALGRQLGLQHDDLTALGTGGLLFDIGKLRVDAQLLEKPDALDHAEVAEARRHVEFGEAMLQRQEVEDDIMDMVLHHHERFDGSGYPKGLVGDAIPLFGRIAGLVDTFDAMISDRSYRLGLSTAVAMRELNQLRDSKFQAELVDELIQAIGIYPAGTLVELSTGEVAVVIAEGRTRRLRPTVLVLLDGDKQPVQSARSINMLLETTDARGVALEIRNSLAPNAFGIEIDGLAL